MFFKYKKNTLPAFELGVFDNYDHYMPSIFDDLLFIDGERKSDIFYLFNQSRIDKLISKEKIEKYFDRLYQLHPDSPFKNSSDDVIIKSIVSRRISNFNDLYSYSKYLANAKKSVDSDLIDSMEEDSYKSLKRTHAKQLDDLVKRYKENNL